MKFTPVPRAPTPQEGFRSPCSGCCFLSPDGCVCSAPFIHCIDELREHGIPPGQWYLFVWARIPDHSTLEEE